jgi:serine/threonine protein kinase
LKLDWPIRQKNCLGAARGLDYLHEESIIKIGHGDIKTSNVFLDKELNAKISDFGLAKLNEDGQYPHQHSDCWNHVSSSMRTFICFLNQG